MPNKKKETDVDVEKIAKDVVNDGETVETSPEDTEKISDETTEEKPEKEKVNMITTTDLKGNNKHTGSAQHATARGLGYNPKND